MIELYQFGTAKLYGQGLISAAADCAAQTRFGVAGGWANKIVIGLAYAGGCLLPVLFFARRLWTKRELLIGGGLAVAAAVAALWATGVGSQFDWGFRLQMGLMLAAGIHLLLLAAAELWRRRDAVSLLLALWLGSGLAFAAVLNWTVSARSFLPLAPGGGHSGRARLDAKNFRRRTNQPHFSGRWEYQPPISVLIAAADCSLAHSARAAAQQLAAEYPPATNSCGSRATAVSSITWKNPALCPWIFPAPCLRRGNHDCAIQQQQSRHPRRQRRGKYGRAGISDLLVVEHGSRRHRRGILRGRRISAVRLRPGAGGKIFCLPRLADAVLCPAGNPEQSGLAAGDQSRTKGPR